jgi:hypothetical protein
MQIAFDPIVLLIAFFLFLQPAEGNRVDADPLTVIRQSRRTNRLPVSFGKCRICFDRMRTRSTGILASRLQIGCLLFYSFFDRAGDTCPWQYSGSRS